MRTQIFEQAVVVNHINGQAWIMNGQVRGAPIKDGDLLAPGTVVTLDDAARLETERTPAPLLKEGADNAPAEEVLAALAGQDAAAIARAILEGRDPTQGFAAPAAGAAGGGVVGGSGNAGFVTVDRTGDATLAESGYDSTYQAAAVANIGAGGEAILINQLTDGNEAVTVVEDGEVSGNLLANADNPDGPDDASIVSYSWGVNLNVPAGVSAVLTGIGTLLVNADGSYTFTPAADYDGAVPVVTYLVTDGEDTVTSTLQITIIPGDDPVVLSGLDVAGGELTVSEANLPAGSSPDAASLTQSGTFMFSAKDGVATLSIAGVDLIVDGVAVTLPVSLTTDLGNTLQVTAVTYDPLTGSGSVTYSYTLLENEDHVQATADDSLLESLVVALVDEDGDTTSASLDVTVLDDTPSVSSNDVVQLDDDALANGNAGGVGDDSETSTLSGTLNFSTGADGGTVAWQTGSDGTFTYTLADDGSTLEVWQGDTLVMTVALDSSTDAYTITQLAAITHETEDDENNVTLNLGYVVTDGDGDTATGTLTINVDDDTPVASDDSATVVSPEGQNVNVAFVLDFSGSINNSELKGMLYAVKQAAAVLYNSTTGEVRIEIVIFSDAAIAYTVSSYDELTTLLTSLQDHRPLSGYTSFSDAVESLMATYSAEEGWNNQVFFVSDGNANLDTGSNGQALDDSIAQSWSEFVSDGDINITTIAVGKRSELDTTHLQQIDVDGSTSVVYVENFAALIPTLTSLVSGTLVSGNVLANDEFGADGLGQIVSITVDGVTYTWDGSDAITYAGGTYSGSEITISTQQGGTFTFNFATGDWTYQTATSVEGDFTESISYSLVDGDGDPTAATLTIFVEDSSPVVITADEQALQSADATIVEGNLSALIVGEDLSSAIFTFSHDTSALASLTSNGITLTYSVSDDGKTLTATANNEVVFTITLGVGGAFTFTLYSSLDHGSSSSQLVFNFASLLEATTASGSELTLAGAAQVIIVDDTPSLTVSAVSTTNLTLQTSDSDATQSGGTQDSVNVSSAFVTAVNANYGADSAGSLVVSGYSLTLLASDSGLTSGGESIVLTLVDGVVIGTTALSGVTVFTISVDDSGELVLTQSAAIDHDAGEDVASLATSLVELTATATVTDGDGDVSSSSITLDLGSLISFTDAGPSLSTSEVDDTALVLQTTDGSAQTSSVSFAAAFAAAVSVDYGADGAGSTVISHYALTLSGDKVDSGLTSQGETIWLTLVDGEVVGTTEHGTIVFTLSVDDSGNVTLSQSAALDQSGELATLADELVTLTATVTATDSDGDEVTSTLSVDLGANVQFADAEPTLNADQAIVSEGHKSSVNLLLMVDVSGSMLDRISYNGQSMTRLAATRLALTTLLQEYQDNSQDVRVRLVQFSGDGNPSTDDATALGNGWLTVAQALTYISTLGQDTKSSDQTNYDAALAKAEEAFATGGALTDGQNVAYFFSDGVPNLGGGISSSEQQSWQQFLNQNDILSYAVGIGSNATLSKLEPIAWDGQLGKEIGAVSVVNESQLEPVLKDTVVVSTVSGNVLTNDQAGADGWANPALVSVSYNDRIYTFDATHTSYQIAVEGGTLTISHTGSYSFTSDGTDINAPLDIALIYTAADSDGDEKSAMLHITVTDQSDVVAYDNADVAVVRQVEQTITHTTVLADFEHAHSAGSWEFDTSWWDSNVVSIDSHPTADQWGVQGDVEQHQHALVMTDNWLAKDAVLLTPQFLVSDSGQLSFDVDIDWLDAKSALQWEILDSKSQAVQSGQVNQDGTITSALLTSGNYRVRFTLTDRTLDLAAARVSIDNLQLLTMSTVLVTETVAASGNVLTDGNLDVHSSDSWGAVDDPGSEGATLQIWSGSHYTTVTDGTQVIGNYGTLIVDEDGSYQYTPNTDLTSVGQQEVFTYRLVQADGDSDDATLTIDIGGGQSSASQSSTNLSTQGETLVGTPHDDVLTGHDGDDLLQGLAGDDHLDGGAGNDRLEGGAGNDILIGGNGDDVLIGGAGNDELYGGTGNDQLQGGSGNDLLLGGAGNDILKGGTGADMLQGGAGDDQLKGGEGSDTFVWKSSDGGGKDVVSDFTVGQGGDILDISDLVSGSSTGGSLDKLLTFSFDSAANQTTMTVTSDNQTTTQSIVLSGVDLTEGGTLETVQIVNSLLELGNLKVDP